MHNLNRAAINEHVKNTIMATVSNVTSSHTVLERLNEMSYVMGTNSGEPAKVCYIYLADPNNLPNDD